MKLDVGIGGLDPNKADIFLDLDHVLFRVGNDGREGFILAHRLRLGWCFGTIWTDTKHERSWNVASAMPLTLTPSILCACGEHGFVRNGKWVPA